MGDEGVCWAVGCPHVARPQGRQFPARLPYRIASGDGNRFRRLDADTRGEVPWGLLPTSNRHVASRDEAICRPRRPKGKRGVAGGPDVTVDLQGSKNNPVCGLFMSGSMRTIVIQNLHCRPTLYRNGFPTSVNTLLLSLWAAEKSKVASNPW